MSTSPLALVLSVLYSEMLYTEIHKRGRLCRWLLCDCMSSSTVCPGFCPPPAEGDVVFNINLLISPYIHLGYVQNSVWSC